MAPFLHPALLSLMRLQLQHESRLLEGGTSVRLQFVAVADRVLLLLLLTDVALLLPYVGGLYGNPLEAVQLAARSQDLGHRFLQLKELWITGLLLELALRRLSYLYFAWAALFGFLMLDSGFHFNAQLGALLVGGLELSGFGLSPVRLGQLMVTVAIGSIFLAVLVPAHLFAQRQHKPLSMGLFGAVAALAAFGVVLDTLFAAAGQSPFAAPVGALAATGQMLAVSGALWLVLRTRIPTPPTSAEKSQRAHHEFHIGARPL